MLPLPKIALPASDYPRLEQLARVAAQQGNMDATFGAALIGLSVGQAIEFPTPGHETRSLTVLGVSP